MAKSADNNDNDDWAKIYFDAREAFAAAGDPVIKPGLWCMRRDGVVGVDSCCGIVHEVPHGYYIYVPPKAESPLLNFTERVTIRALNGPVMVTEHAASRLDWPLLCPLRAGQCATLAKKRAGLEKGAITLTSLNNECAVVLVSYEEDEKRGSMQYFFFDEPICALICDLMKDLCRLSSVTHVSMCHLYDMAKRVKKTFKKHALAASAADKSADESADELADRPSRKRQRTE